MTQYLTPYDLVKGKKLVERYTVLGLRRQSGFAAVYEAADASGARCEVSLFPAGLFERAAQADEFCERLLPWKDVRSPRVLRVHDVLPVAGGLLLVTDVPAGESLREVLVRRKRLNASELVALARQLLEALDSLHGAGLVHGDVKPPTIFVAGEENGLSALLADGGVTPGLWNAKGLGEKTALIGTPFYAPIEQFGGDVADVRSDIYNLATVLYECATGVLPWKGHTFLEVFQAKLQDPPAMKKRAADVEVDGKVEGAILRGCSADRRKRYSSAKEFALALVE